MRKKRKVCIGVFCLLAILGILIGIVYFAGLYLRSRQEVGNVEDVEIIRSTDGAETIVVDTPFETIICTNSTAHAVRTNVIDSTNYTVEFFCRLSDDVEYHLFDVWFSQSDEQTIGQIKTKNDTYVYVGITSYSLEEENSLSEEDAYAFYATQELANDILTGFLWVDTETEVGNISSNNASSDDVIEDIVIDTPYVPLVYPGKWEDNLYFETYSEGDMYQVEFYGVLPNREIQHLFTIQFGAESDSRIGDVYSETGESIPVNLIPGMFQMNEAWEESENLLLLEMQEDVNYLIENLAMITE